MQENDKFRHGRQAEDEEEQLELEEEPAARKGITTPLLIVLVCVALVCGAAFGYLIGSRYSTADIKLREAEAKIEEYEMIIAGIYTDEIVDGGDTQASDDGQNGDPEGIATDLSGISVPEADTPETLIVAKYDGGEVTSEEALARYEELTNSLALDGEDISSSEQLLARAIEEIVAERVAYAKAEELGLTDYTESDEAAIDETAKAEYVALVEVYSEFNDDPEGYLEETEGITLESLTADIRADYWKTKLYNSVTEGVNVSSTQITESYDTLLEEQTLAFAGNHAAFENALTSGEVIVYYPEGYRNVKLISAALDPDSALRAYQIKQSLETADEAEAAELQAEYDALYSDSEDAAKRFISRVNAGEEFETVASDMGLPIESVMIAEDTFIYDTALVEATMALETPGDVSGVVKTEDGVYVLRYASNAESGAIPLSSVSAMLTARAKGEAMDAAYEAALSEWLEAAHAEYHPEYILDRLD